MDYKTLFIVLVSVFLIQAVALFQTWWQNREEIGLRDWAIAAILISLGSFFSVLALNMLPSAVTAMQYQFIIIFQETGNAMGIAGWFMIWIGVRHFYKRASPAYVHVGLFSFFMVAIMMQENIFDLPAGWRVFWVSVVIAFFAGMTLYEFLKQQVLNSGILLLISGMLFATSAVWLFRGLTVIGFIDLGVDEKLLSVLSLYDGIVASVSLTVSMILLTNERIHEHLNALAIKDPLTGTLNRRAFFEYSEQLIADRHRNHENLALCLIDLDFFKKINDTHGHPVGDLVLKKFAQLAHTVLREGDLFGRYGGEEFIILLRRSSEAEAHQIIDRLRESWSKETIRTPDETLTATFSAGISHISGTLKHDLVTLLERADNALYQAKNDGRNRTVLAPVTVSEV